LDSVRTVAVTISPLLASLMTEVLKPRLSLDLVGVVQDRATLADSLRKLTPDLVVFGLIGEETDAAALPFRAVLPSAVILVLSSSGHYACLYERSGRRIALSNLSVSALAGALAACFPVSPPKKDEPAAHLASAVEIQISTSTAPTDG
jgi:chemotaxis response regulator CheB